MGNLLSGLQAGGKGALSKAELERLERRVRKLGRGRAEVALSDLRAEVDPRGDNPWLQRVFDLYDRDGDRLLDLGEMRTLMEALARLGDEEARCRCETRWRWRRRRQSGPLLAWPFLTSPPPTPSSTSPPVAFRVLDADGDGAIGRDELRRALVATNRRGLAPDQLDAVVEATLERWGGGDGGGRLGYDDFRAMLAGGTQGALAL
jgi:Ca2+-binding EF-hand superfamily protein